MRKPRSAQASRSSAYAAADGAMPICSPRSPSSPVPPISLRAWTRGWRDRVAADDGSPARSSRPAGAIVVDVVVAAPAQPGEARESKKPEPVPVVVFRARSRILVHRGGLAAGGILARRAALA